VLAVALPARAATITVEDLGDGPVLVDKTFNPGDENDFPKTSSLSDALVMFRSEGGKPMPPSTWGE
jgi:hypothetical protein